MCNTVLRTKLALLVYFWYYNSLAIDSLARDSCVIETDAFLPSLWSGIWDTWLRVWVGKCRSGKWPSCEGHSTLVLFSFVSFKWLPFPGMDLFMYYTILVFTIDELLQHFTWFVLMVPLHKQKWWVESGPYLNYPSNASSFIIFCISILLVYTSF